MLFVPGLGPPETPPLPAAESHAAGSQGGISEVVEASILHQGRVRGHGELLVAIVSVGALVGAAASRGLTGTLVGVGLEVRVVAGTLGRDAAGRVIHQHHLEELEAIGVEARAQGQRLVSDPLGERALKVGVRGDTGPDILGWRAERAVGTTVSELCKVKQYSFARTVARTGRS